MRAPLLALTLCVSVAAQAATVSGRVVHQDKPVAAATVRLYGVPTRGLAGCPLGLFNDVLTLCLCPARREAFTAKARAGLESLPPAASATTAADGTFSLAVEGAGPFQVRVSSADGALGAAFTLGEKTGDIALVPTRVSRIRTAGLTEGVAVYAVDSTTGEALRSVERDGVWVSPPLPPGLLALVTVAPGAVPQAQPMHDGRLLAAFTAFGFDKGPPTVTLSAPQTLRGLVTEHGKGVAGAVVVADPDSCALATKSDASGAFTLPAVAAAPFLTTVIARSNGKFAKASGAGGAALHLELGPPARLEVTFVDRKGAAVQGVFASALGASQRAPTSDAQGRWSSGELVEGETQLLVSPPWLSMDAPKLKVAGVTKLERVVVRGVSITGQVRDPKGKPLEGVSVSAFFPEALQAQVSGALKDALRSVSATSDAQGKFTLEPLLPGPYEVVANSLAFGEGTAPSTAPGAVVLTVASPFALEGVVVDAAGTAVAGAVLQFHRKDDPGTTLGTSTGPDGRFRYALRAPGTFEVTASRSAGSAKGKVQRAEVPGPAVTFVVGEKAELRGTIVDARGPRAGVLVQAVSVLLPQALPALMTRQPLDAAMVLQAKEMGMYAEATSAKDGTFSIPTDSPSLLFAEADGETTELTSADPRTPARLVLSKHARATGRVLDWNGKPPPFFSINGKRFDAAGGRFEVPLPAQGSAMLSIDAPFATLQTRTVQVPSGGGDVALGDIALERAFTVRGKVLAAATGKPISGARLEVRSEGGPQWGSLQPDGSFTLERVPAGKLTVTANSPGYAPAVLSLEVKGDVTAKPLQLERGASLEVTALRGGEPVESVSLEVTGPAGFPANSRSLRTSSDGTVQLEELAPGRWKVKALPSGPALEVTLKAGERARRDLTLP